MALHWRWFQRTPEHRHTVAQLLASAAVRQAIATQAERCAQPLLEVEREAVQLLDGMLPESDPRVLARLNRVVTPLFRHMYQSLEVNGLQQLGPLSQTHRLVYLPCHRSHMDYLLLAWVLYGAQLEPAHIIAGDNLNLPLIGPVLRRGGALFMRRRFRDDPFYSALFNACLRYSLQHHPLEFFIEGGRSRTGRLLPPRLGALDLTLRQTDAAPSRPLALVPVAINYDLCLENRSYQQELAGRAKKRESLLGTLLSASALLRRCGGAYLSIGEPLLPAAGSGAEPLPLADTGHELLRRINAASVASPMAQIASLLLASPELGIEETRLPPLLARLNTLVTQLGTPTPGTTDPQAWIDAALARRQVDRLHGRILASPRQAAGLCFYRNTLLHTLLLPGLLLLLAARLPRPGKASITRLLRALLPYLDAEFHLPPRWRGAQAPIALRDLLLQQQLLVASDGQLHPSPSALSKLLMQLAEPVLLRQYLLIRLLVQHRCITTAQLLELSAALASHIHGWYGHPAPDYADRRQLALLIEQLVAGGILERREERVQPTRELTPLLRIGAKLLPAVLLQECERWLGQH